MKRYAFPLTIILLLFAVIALAAPGDKRPAVTSAALWPWNNEDRIKSEMCDSSYLQSVGRDTTYKPAWCASSKTLTSYVWEYMGNEIPSDLYGNLDPIPGSCGSSDGLALSSAPVTGLCTAGTASSVSGTGPWSWTCAGSGGGSTASCGATLLEIPSGGASAVVACPVMAGFR